MYWTKQKKNAAIEIVLDSIANGQSLKSIITERSRKEVPSYPKFMEWISENDEVRNRYAGACEERQLKLLDEMIEIADKDNLDYKLVKGEIKIDGEAVARSRLRWDARRWALSKMNPKKYGEKVDVTSDGEKLTPNPVISIAASLSTETLLLMKKELDNAKVKE